MNKLITIAAGAAVAVAISLSFASPSVADPGGDAIGAGIVGGMLGFMAGSAVAGSGGHVHVESGYEGGGSSWRHHVRRCFREYGDSYDPQSDTFTDDDGYDRRCRL